MPVGIREGSTLATRGGVSREDEGLRCFQPLLAVIVPIDLPHRLNVSHELETGVVGLEIRVSQHIRDGDEEVPQRDLVVAEIDGVAQRTKVARSDFQTGWLRSLVERQRHIHAPFKALFSTALLPQRLPVFMIPIML